MVHKPVRKGVGGSTRSSVEVLLAENVDSLGTQGDIVRVKPGYARNYLLPHGLATVATDENKAMVDKHRQRLAELEKGRIKDLKTLGDSVSKHSVTLEANASPDGQLYGSIVAKDISDSLKTSGFAIEQDQIKLDGPLKELGMYTISLRLHEKVKSEVKVWVVPTATT
jgi:large subunit ribosomal protein L9